MEIIRLVGTLAVFLCVQSSVEGLICYDCGQASITQQKRCNATSTCPQGQRCLLKSLVSSLDGHRQFEMRCGNIEECDGVEIVPVGKRAVHSRSLTLQCCTTDRCNVPSFGPVVPADCAAKKGRNSGNGKTYTSVESDISPIFYQKLVLKSVEKVGSCLRDIEVMLEDSTSVSVADHTMLVQFLKSFVNHMSIGARATQVGLSTYDTNVEHEWDLDKYLTNAELTTALDHLTFSYHVKNSADIHRVVDFITDHALRHINGDRNLFQDSVVIFVDQNTHVRLRESILKEQQKLSSVSRDVVIVVIGSGQDSPEITQLYHLASSSGHVIHVPSYSALVGLEQKLVNLLCH